MSKKVIWKQVYIPNVLQCNISPRVSSSTESKITKTFPSTNIYKCIAGKCKCHL